jgi:hypothetical protein
MNLKKAMMKVERQRKSNAKSKPLSPRALQTLKAIQICDEILDEQEGIDYENVDGKTAVAEMKCIVCREMKERPILFSIERGGI